MNNEEMLAYQQMQSKVAQSELNMLKTQQAVTLFSNENGKNENLIKFQLDIENSLFRIERLLRKQIPKRDNKGNLYYADCPENQLFNEYGINEIMNLLSWYVNKEIILSNYSDEQIDLIMYQFSDELIDFIYTNSEKFGMDTLDKKKHYPMVVMNIMNIVDATYRRSLGGLERQGLNEARVVTQSENLGKQMMYPSIKKHKGGMLNPANWRA